MTAVDGKLIETDEQARATGLPILAADVMWIKVNGGHAHSSLSDWEEDRDPVIGETVLISDGGPFVPAKIEAILPDGEITLLAPQYARRIANSVA